MDRTPILLLYSYSEYKSVPLLSSLRKKTF